MKIVEYFSTNNDCYRKNINKVDSRYTNFQTNGPSGLMLHSVGCPQPNAEVFAKSWNRSGYEVAVHGVLQADGTVYQCLPWNFRGWHAGGAANNTHIGVEMTEPDCIKYTGGSNFTCSNVARAKEQVAGTYKVAVELFAYLCKKYNLDPTKDGVIISHKEGCARGLASNHGDPEHLWNQLGMGYTMDGFRKDVKAAMGGTSTPTPVPTPVKQLYRVRKTWADSKSQIGAYSVLANAQAACDKAGSGYYVFDASGNVVYPVATTTTRPTLRSGSTGDAVKELQTRLNELGYSCGTLDGIFGTKTVAAVKKFQTAKGLTVDGIVGEKTWEALYTQFEPYKVKVTVDALNIRAGAGTNYNTTGCIKDKGVYTIVAESNGFGKLKSGAGWICLDYTKKA